MNQASGRAMFEVNKVCMTRIYEGLISCNAGVVQPATCNVHNKNDKNTTTTSYCSYTVGVCQSVCEEWGGVLFGTVEVDCEISSSTGFSKRAKIFSRTRLRRQKGRRKA
ncbi:hypothetical protein T12_7526 [Trichinella patagoniensis]|uniref:Uncharacterized protein n=1 Tax=Trichinella patagoniensis TaxID=990121 RepID=A0A0V0ZKX6_9BILA|nr:hypothetical protein T12_7526 [Trichinella patagoniensis]